MKIKKIKRIVLQDPIPVFDIQLDIDNTFYAEDVVVHNSSICRSRAGLKWLASTLKGIGHNLPFEQTPLHPFCRSVIGALLKGYDQNIENDLNYDAWLKRQDAETQIEVLGKRKREIWLKQGLTQKDLVNQAGRPLTVEQLEAKYNL